jgi:hypothetical protein
MSRPRTHPEGTTASDRKRMSEDTRIAGGARRRHWLLSQTTIDGLAAIQGRTGERSPVDVVERLVREAVERS